MAPALDPAIAEQMRQQARSIKERTADRGTFTPTWNLTGGKAIVEPGKSVVARLCPRWDYADSMVLQGDKRVPNPNYKGGRIFVLAFEHWWEDGQGKTQRVWCPRSNNDAAVCPICNLASAMMSSSSKDDQKFGKRIQSKAAYLFNAVVNDPRPNVGRLLVKEGQNAGRGDIRMLSCSETLFTQISDIMTGGENPKFARGDISHPREGYDIALIRPSAGIGERWKVDCAPNPSQLYEQSQAAAFKGWPSLLINLEEVLEKEIKTPLELFKAFYGRDPGPEDNFEGGEAVAQDEQETSQDDLDSPDVATNPFGQPTDAPSNPAPSDPDDDFMPPAPSAPAQAPKAAAPRSQMATRPPAPSSRGGRPGGRR